MTEESFVKRYEELVKENESLKARLVAMDRELERGGDGPLKKLYPIGDYCRVFTEGVKLDLSDIHTMTARQGKDFTEIEACKVLGIMLAYKASREGYVEIKPRLSDGYLEAHMALVKLK